MTLKELHQLAVENIRCPYCDALPGAPCLTRGARRSPWPHSGRTYAIHQAWGAGYMEGEEDMLTYALDSPDWFARRLAQRQQERAEVGEP